MGNDVSALQHRLGGRAAAEELSLLRAVLAGDAGAMRAVLQQSPAAIYAHSKDGEGIWHAAVQGGHEHMLQAVQDAVAETQASQNPQERLRLQAAQGLNQVNQVVNQVLASAVVVPLPAVLAMPMGASLDVNSQTRDGLTPLMAAAQAGRAGVLRRLLDLGADAWRGDSDGATALHHAAWTGRDDCLVVLLQHAEGVELAWAATAAAAAGGGGGGGISRAAGASGGRTRLVDITSNTGLTALHYAAWREQCGAITHLVNAGAAISAASCSDTMGAVAANAGSTPLHMCAMKGGTAAARLLLRANRRLLALAAADGRLAAVADGSSGLLGDIRGVTDRYGKTPARLAWDMQRSDLALILDPATPLSEAIQLATTGTGTAAGGGGKGAALDARSAAESAARAVVARAAVQVAPVLQAVSRGAAAGPLLPPPPPSAPHRLPAPGSKSGQVTSSGSRQPGTSAVVPAAGAAPAAPSLTPQQQQQHPASFDPDFPDSSPAAPAPTAQQQQQQRDSLTGLLEPADSLSSLPEPPPHLVCPITNRLMRDPVRACDGGAYERESLAVCFELGNRMLPGGRAAITSTAVAPDPALAGEAAAWRVAALAAARPAEGAGGICVAAVCSGSGSV